MSSNYLYQSQWFNLRQDKVKLPAGDEITYTQVEHPGYAMIVPLMQNGAVLLERIYRYTLQQTLLECPSGGLDGEAPEVAAKRELLEETGWVAASWTPLGQYYGSSGISDELFYLFLAQDLRYQDEPSREPTEQMTIEFMSLKSICSEACKQKIAAGPSMLALLLAQRFLESQH